ncbi:hypothetical protein QX776_17810 [Alteromonadaceae bacterium BrNp21-10]|nr:hypothetical protein [Alteromonadaceae bacterium BrNp21-10]
MDTDTDIMHLGLILVVSRYKTLYKLLVINIVGISTFCAKADWQFIPSINSSIDMYERTYDEQTEENNEVLSLAPSALITFKGNKVDGSLNASYRYLIRNDEDEETRNSFSNYNLRLNNQPFSFLKLNLTANESFRSQDPSRQFSSDIISTPNQMTKTKRYSGTVTINNPQPKVMGTTLTYNTSKSKVEKLEIDTNTDDFSNTNQRINLRLFQGKNFSKTNWNINATLNKTQRQNAEDVKSINVSSNFSFSVLDNIRLIFNSLHEEHDLNNDSNITIQQDNYGAGLQWYIGANRNISLTYNNSSSDGYSDNSDQSQSYVGTQINWAFSPRTLLRGGYSKRFYGDAYNFSFNYNLRKLKAALDYQENITTYSRFSNTNASSLFVCPVSDNIQFADCFIPDIGYDLLPGEQAYDFNQYVPELTEEVIISKTANGTLSYNFRKLRLGMGVRSGTTEYIESNRSRKDESIRLFATYTLGRSMTVNANANWQTSDTDISIDNDNVTTKTTSIGLNNSLSRQLTTTLNLRYIDRDSPVLSDSLKEKRITLNVSYTFGSKNQTKKGNLNHNDNFTN